MLAKGVSALVNMQVLYSKMEASTPAHKSHDKIVSVSVGMAQKILNSTEDVDISSGSSEFQLVAEGWTLLLIFRLIRLHRDQPLSHHCPLSLITAGFHLL